MSDHFYDGQVRRYLTQFMRAMSSFSYKDAKGKLTQVPVRYGDMTRQVAQILSKNSENIVQSAPFIACYIKDLSYDRERLQDPTFVSKVQVREREYEIDPVTGQRNYLNIQGANYTIERLMPSPYTVTFTADIWTSNTEQKLQLWEQIVVLFNPALEIQSTDNYFDWTSLSYLELASQTFESRSIPQGMESDISICTLNFTSPIWITPPAKVKKLGIITKIISNVFTDVPGNIDSGAYKDLGLTDLFAGRVARAKTVITPGNFDLLVLNNVANILPLKQSNINDELTDITGVSGKANWKSLLDLYPGEFSAGLSQIRLIKSDGNEIVAYCSLNPTDDAAMVLSIDTDTIPSNTIIGGRGTVDAIVNPVTFVPTSPTPNTRYLILEDINNYDLPDGTNDAWRADAWRSSTGTSFVAHANDIIEWTGTAWTVVFDSQETTDITYITNSYTGIQYKWDGEQWTKSFEGVYDRGSWRLIL